MVKLKDFLEVSEPKTPKEKNIDFKTISEPKEILSAKNIETVSKELKTPEKDIKIQPTPQNIREILKDIALTQDDYWFFLRYLTRDKTTTIRLNKTVLEPIYKEFINNQ